MSLPADMNGPLEVQLHLCRPVANLMSLCLVQFQEMSDSEGNPLENFDVWFFKVPEPGKDLHSENLPSLIWKEAKTELL